MWRCFIAIASNLQLDDRLVAEAAALGKDRTKEEAVTQALTDYIRYLRQDRILDLFWRVEFDPDYDFKRQRARA